MIMAMASAAVREMGRVVAQFGEGGQCVAALDGDVKCAGLQVLGGLSAATCIQDLFERVLRDGLVGIFANGALAPDSFEYVHIQDCLLS